MKAAFASHLWDLHLVLKWIIANAKRKWHAENIIHISINTLSFRFHATSYLAKNWLCRWLNGIFVLDLNINQCFKTKIKWFFLSLKTLDSDRYSNNDAMGEVRINIDEMDLTKSVEVCILSWMFAKKTRNLILLNSIRFGQSWFESENHQWNGLNYCYH